MLKWLINATVDNGITVWLELEITLKWSCDNKAVG